MRPGQSHSTATCVIGSVLAGTLVWGAMVPSALAQSASSQKKSATAQQSGKEAAEPSTKKPAETAPSQPDAAPTPELQKASEESLAAGQSAFQAGDYPAAERHFSKARAAVPSAHALYWQAMSIDMQGKTPEAVAALEEFLADPGAAAVGEEKVESAKQRLEALKKIPATIAVTVTPASAKIAVDGVPQKGQSPFALKVSQGAHKVSIAAEGFETAELDVNVKPGEAAEKSIQLKAAPKAVVAATEPVEAPPAPPPQPPSKVPAYVTLGIAGASAVAGTIFGILALSAKSDYDQNPTVSKADEVERDALIADMAWGVTLTLGITGIVLLTNDETPPKSVTGNAQPRRVTGRLNVAPYFSPLGGGAAARLTF